MSATDPRIADRARQILNAVEADLVQLSVGDPVLGKTRLLSRQCDTCIFRPGNPMHLTPGRLKQLVDTAVADGSYVICHDTLPYGEHPEAQPAICRGFADRYTTWRLQVIACMFGFVEISPPGESGGTANEPGGE